MTLISILKIWNESIIVYYKTNTKCGLFNRGESDLAPTDHTTENTTMALGLTATSTIL